MKKAANMGHDPFLILSLISAESSLKPTAKSKVGARGLMQIMPSTFQALADRVEKDPMLGRTNDGEPTSRPAIHNIEDNICLGTMYFTNLALRFQNFEDAICAYNLGPTLFEKRKANGGPMPKKYLAKILARYRELVQARESRNDPMPTLFEMYDHRIMVAKAD